MVNMASGMDDENVHLATMTLHNIAVIQLIPSHAVLNYNIDL